MIAAERASPKLSLGLLVSGTSVSKYIFRFAKWAQDHPHLELLYIFAVSAAAHADDGQHPGSVDAAGANDFAPSAISKLFFSLIVVAETLLIRSNRRYHDHLQKFDLSTLPSQIRIHRPQEPTRSAIRSDFQWLCHEPRTSGWQCYRVRPLRARDGRKMAGTAQANRAARDASGATVQSGNNRTGQILHVLH